MRNRKVPLQKISRREDPCGIWDIPLLDGNDIALRELLLCGLRQRDLQDAVFELRADVLRLHMLTDIEAAAARTGTVL